MSSDPSEPHRTKPLHDPEAWPSLPDPDAAPPPTASPGLSLEIEPLDATGKAWSLEIEDLDPPPPLARVPRASAPSAAPLAASTVASSLASAAASAPANRATKREPADWDLEPDPMLAARAAAVAAATSIGAGAARDAAAADSPPVYREHLRFHGEGSEYFRVWVVNLFLTLITLGIYSAWAKVRKARWFAQHTALAGDRFDYHGEPWRVLLGRVVGLALLGVWTFSFELSPVAGLVVLALFCVVGPLLFASAQRFRMANTSWRGLRFGFDVPRVEAYLVCVPLLLVWTSGSVLEKLGVKGPTWYAFAFLATAIGLPWAHARLKQLQHHHAHYGEQQFAFRPAGRAFYTIYLKALLFVLVGVIVSSPLANLAAQATAGGPVARMLAMAVAGLFVWLAAWPFFAARMQQVVWSHTELGHSVRFAGRMRGSKLFGLVMGQTLLTLLTLGLYWPFATVAIARYRVESIMVESDDPFGEVAGGMNVERRAAGDAAIDFFGLDLGW